MGSDLPMPDVLRPLAEDALKRLSKRGAAPEVVSLPEQGYFQNLSCPYREEDALLWTAMLLDCFGTRVQAVGQAFFRQLAALCPSAFYLGEDQLRRDEEAIRQALAIVHSLKPRNEAEAAQAAQFVALHLLTMKVGASVANHTYVEPRTAAAMAALVKASAAQMSAIHKGRGKGTTRQTIKVIKRQEQHVHYHDERHVHLPGEGGGKPGGQFLGSGGTRARATPALRGPEAVGKPLSVLSAEGEEAVQIPRR